MAAKDNTLQGIPFGVILIDKKLIEAKMDCDLGLTERLRWLQQIKEALLLSNTKEKWFQQWGIWFT